MTAPLALVTGAAGFIGSHVCDALIGRGFRVRGLDNFDPFYDPAIKRGNAGRLAAGGNFELVEGDIRDRDVVQRAMAGVGCVLHLAAKAGVRASLADPVGYADVNVRGTAIVLEEADRADVGRVLLASSSGVYGERATAPFRETDPCDRPVSPYAATKLATEHLGAAHVRGTGAAVTCLRFFTVYGARQRPEMAVHAFARAIDEGRPITVFGDGSARRDFTHVDDIVDGVLRALDRAAGFHIYNLGEERTVAVSELITLLASVMEREAIVEHRPPAPGDVSLTSADVSLARADLGYAPSVPIEEGLERFVAWLRRR